MSGARGPRRRPTGGLGAPGQRRAAPSRARRVALRVLERVERGGAYADLALHSALAEAGLPGEDRALATELVYGTLRWQGRLDHLLAQVLDRPPAKLEPVVRCLLRLGAYQIVLLDHVSSPAAVDQTVRCARAAGVERAAGLVNAALRRLAREHEHLPLPSLSDDPVGHLTHALSLPPWLAERFVAQYGPEEAAALARASNEAPPLSVRWHRERTTRDELVKRLREQFPELVPAAHAPFGLVLGHGGSPGAHADFRAGLFTVQDEGSQLVAELLDARPGERVLDVCAAPGAKATALAEAVGSGGAVLALDRHARRLELVRREARRLGLPQLSTRAFDATQTLAPVAPDASYDRVLVDAPCSGLGTLRRNADARWRISPDDLPGLASLQLALLRRAATALRPGGALVYSTCTLAAEENEDVVHDFLGEHGSRFRLASRDALPSAVRPLVGEDGFLRCLPHRDGTDGFFAARFERTR